MAAVLSQQDADAIAGVGSLLQQEVDAITGSGLELQLDAVAGFAVEPQLDDESDVDAPQPDVAFATSYASGFTYFSKPSFSNA